jgi:hypothetical protein
MNVVVTSDRQLTLPLDQILGSFRTFGLLGPVYEILDLADPKTGPDVNVRVRVVESGEELDYPLAAALDDPLAL